MKTRIIFIVVVMLSMTINVFSQQRRVPGGAIKGTIIDSKVKKPVEYANIVLYGQKDSVQVTGTISNEKGAFQMDKIRPGMYFIGVQFIGYEMKRINDIVIKRGQAQVDLGEVNLDQSSIMMETVEVVAEQASMEYRIDKKVINVSQQHTAISGTAVDVLENVPSVTVDIEGNVSLRGSSNFTVLIEGRPTILDANEALEQIPASAIENIEIVTNPSAKYDPDGTSGIINIVMKKNKLVGSSGIVNMNGGMESRRGIDFLYSYRNGGFTANLGGDYRKRNHPGNSIGENRTTFEDKTSYILSDGESSRSGNSHGVRGQVGFNVTSNDLLDLGIRYGYRSSKRGSELDYDEWSDLMPDIYQYISRNSSDRSGPYYTANLDYIHRFAGKGHELSSQINYSHRDSDEESKDELLGFDGAITSGRISTEDGPGDRFHVKIDYVLPNFEKNRFEAGYQTRISNSEDVTGLYDFNPVLNKYEFLDIASHSTDYNRNIHSLYTMYAGEMGNFGYQGGLRGEYTYRSVAMTGVDDKFKIDRWDYFPTVHTSYKFTGGQQAMSSYTRRIERPRGYYLEPFETWMDAYNVRKGNPGLKPEYIDSYELGYQTFWGSNLISAEGYYRVTHNKVERVRSVYADNVTLHTTENVGSDYALGTELMLNMGPKKWWDMNLMGNLYNYRVEGDLFGRSFSEESFTWSMRFNNSFKLTTSTRFQINSSYNSPRVSAQGRREDFFMVNMALKKELLQKSLTATLQVRDVFDTARYEFTSSGPDFYTYREYTRNSPVVMLNLSLNINNHKVERRRQEGGGDDSGGEGEEFLDYKVKTPPRRKW